MNGGAILFCAHLLLTLVCLTGCSSGTTPSKPGPKQVFKELSTDDKAQLDKQRALVLGIAKQRYQTPAFTQTKSDLAILQKILDDKVFQKTQTYELQSLGVVFGDVLATELKMHWMIVTDQWGTDPTLRYENSSIQLNALTMIQKRVEDDAELNLVSFLETLRHQVKEWIDSKDTQ